MRRGDEILCWCFNSRDSAPTALRPETRNAWFFTEGVEDWQLEPGRAALEEFGNRLADGGADVRLQKFESVPAS